MKDSTAGKLPEWDGCRSCWNGIAEFDGLCLDCATFFAYFTARPVFDSRPGSDAA